MLQLEIRSGRAMIISIVALAVIAWSVDPALGQATQPARQPASQPGASDENPPADGFDAEGSDAEAIKLADLTMNTMGGRARWDRAHYLAWNFFGARRHVWDKHTGNVRIEGLGISDRKPYVILMNVNTKTGRAWRDGEEITDPDELAEMMQNGLGAWINDSYWLIMPYKLKDSGITLTHLGVRKMEDGREADVLQLTFEDVGVTPQNKYDVYISHDNGLVEQWAFYSSASDEEPRFVTPWADWRRYGRLLLSGDRGELRGRPARMTDIAVFDELPESVFTSPNPIDLSQYPGERGES